MSGKTKNNQERKGKKKKKKPWCELRIRLEVLSASAQLSDAWPQVVSVCHLDAS
jgi:hypothetical protein